MNLKVWSSIVKEAFDAGLFVRGPSMLPTFDITGDLVLAKRISTRLEKLSRGDVVLIRSPENPRKVVPKRLTSIEGDSITYTVDPKSDKHETVVVPKGDVWIEGDNKYVSNNSRKFGSVPCGLIQDMAF